MSLASLPDELADGIVVHTARAKITRDDLTAQIDALATVLRSMGIGPGDVVAAMLANDESVVAALFATWRVGAIYTPLNPRGTAADVDESISAVPPRVVVTTVGDSERFAAALGLVVATDDGWVVERAASPTAAAAAPGSDAVALIQFTSGTTGRPKPVPLRHDTVLDLLDRVVESIRSGAGRGATARSPMPNLVPVSLSLWAGIYQVLFAFRVGAAVVLMDRFETQEFAALVREFEIRSTVLPPAAMTMLCDDDTIDDLSPLRIVRSITAPLSPAQARRFQSRFGVVVLNSYGQTELGGEVVGWTAADARAHGEDKLGSVGRPNAGIQVRAVDADGGPVAAGETGELFVRTPSTAARHVDADLGERLTPDGWFRTGDVGRVDADGFIWVDGRVSDMINRGGLKVFPAQVEEVLIAAPGVRDVAVVGMPDDRLGEVPWAFVVTSDVRLDPEALHAWCRERLTAYKVPVHFVAVAALPRNEVGKVLKRELVALAP